MAYSKINYDNETLIDLTQDTVKPKAMKPGYTAHDGGDSNAAKKNL